MPACKSSNVNVFDAKTFILPSFDQKLLLLGDLYNNSEETDGIVMVWRYPCSGRGAAMGPGKFGWLIVCNMKRCFETRSFHDY